jgi:hypothetical protein
MSTSLFHARQISLALLVIAVVEHGHLSIPDAGTNPSSSALLRIGREFIRRTSHIPAETILQNFDYPRSVSPTTT